MHGSRFRLPDGTVAFIDSSEPRHPKCSTPGCRKAGKMQCDFAVLREHDGVPKVGNARVHKVHNHIYFVRRVHENGTVTISSSPPGSAELRWPQTVSVADWFAKTSATCDKHVCPTCAGHVGSLDFCAEHKPK